MKLPANKRIGLAPRLSNGLKTSLVKLPNSHQPQRKAEEIVFDWGPTQDFKTAFQFIKRGLANSSRAAMPMDLKPMLASISGEAFNSKDWQFEIKWDGYRAISYMDGGAVRLRSRNNLSFNDKFKHVTDALKNWEINAVVDGEVVVLNEDGHADFEALQNWGYEQQGTLVYFVFDILWLDGYNLMDLPLTKRREILAQLIPRNNVIRFSESIEEAGVDFFKVAQQNGLEGIIAKRNDATYVTATRTKSWLKIKAEERHEAVICGYTKNKNTDRLFSSLVLGLPGKNGLTFIGLAGTGFNAAMQKDLFKKMNPLFTVQCPFATVPATGAPTLWVTPYLVCEVKYTELTKDGVMRHPVFQGLRADKTIADLNVDDIKAVAKDTQLQNNNLIMKTKKVALKNSGTGASFLVDMKEEEVVVQVDKKALKFTNIQKLYWGKEKIRKGDLLNYYHTMAEYILPYMKDRPQSLNRHPNGIDGKNFYHKDMKGKLEDWMKTHRRYSESVGENKEFLVCTNEASLLYMANLGCIEMNPWHSRIQKPDYPDWSVIDIDPGTNTFDQVIETALVVKKVLDNCHIPSHIKTSGSTGLHIYIPFGAKYTYEQSKSFAELIVNIVHDELPLITSLERSPLKRKDKIYLDYLQNRPIQTICAPYSCRPKPGATVSTPLHWDEVKKGLDMADFTIHNILDRVKAEGDLFTGVLGKGINLNKVIQQLSQLA